MYPHVRSLQVRNFKGIAELDLELNESLTLLVGVNGVGKTSVIQAALGIVSRVWPVKWPPGAGSLWFDPPGTLLRYGADKGAVSVDVAFKDEKGIKAQAEVRPGELDVDVPFEIEFIVEAQKPSWPLNVFYDQNRIGGLSSREEWRKSDGNNRAQALNTTPYALSDFKSWFFEKEGDEAREVRDRQNLHYTDQEVQAVQKVLEAVAGKGTKLRSRVPAGSTDRQLFVHRSKERGEADVLFEDLSGGEQAFFLLAVDLARRLILEYPERPVGVAPGFVCIDEIELHLHPAWQRDILRKLLNLFRGCQFLVSTHSPQVVSGVEAKHVRLLTSLGDGRVEVRQPLASQGRDSNYVLEGIFKTPEQDPEVDGLFDKSDELIEAGRFAEAELVLDKLDKLVEGGSPQVTLRRARCNRLRRLSG